MNWLERYIDSLKTHLPRQSADDVAAEIRSTLQEEIDGRAADLGRGLEESELLEILKRHGHPLRVAAGYHERRSLVDESVFPLYKTVLQYLLLGLLALHLVRVASAFITAKAMNPIGALIGLAWNYGHAALLAFAFLTLVFYLFRDQLQRWNGLDTWDPRKLGPVRGNAEIIGRGSSLFEFIFSLVMLRALNQDLIAPSGAMALLGISGWSAEALPLVRGLSALIVLSLALNVVNLFQPYWTRSKRWANAALSLLSAVVLVRLYDAATLFAAGTSAETLSIAPYVLDLARMGLGWISLFVFCDAFYSAWRAVRMASRSGTSSRSN